MQGLKSVFPNAVGSKVPEQILQRFCKEKEDSHLYLMFVSNINSLRAELDLLSLIKKPDYCLVPS